MNLVPLAEVSRGGIVESLHYGAVAVVDARGRLLCAAGDPEFTTFTRSTIKPFQALPFMEAGGTRHFGFGSREIALLCASHSGEPMHTDIVQTMLEKSGCTERDLRCGCQIPFRYAAGATPSPGETFTQLHHNCSGKHAGFLAYCVQHGLPLGSYLAPDHALQAAIRRRLANMVGMTETELASGTDGCSAPNYALPLSRLAFAYAQLAQERAGVRSGTCMGVLFDAMTTHPELVSGPGRIDLAFMQAAPHDLVAKGGAEGVQAIGIRSAGVGIAIKIADGNARAIGPVAIAVLERLGLVRSVEASPLARWVRPAIVNARGAATGEIRPVVELRNA